MIKKMLSAFAAGVVAFSAGPLAAQQLKPLTVEQDPNGVDMTSGKTAPRNPTLSIPAAPRLSFNKISDWYLFLEGRLIPNTNGNINFALNTLSSESESISCQNLEYCADNKDGASSISGEYYSPSYEFFKGGTGTKITYDIRDKGQGTIGSSGNTIFYLMASSVEFADGEELTFAYDTYSSSGFKDHRPSSVTSSTGYRLVFTYQSNTGGTSTWRTVSTAKIVATSAPTVELAKFTYSGTTITDLDNRSYDCTGCVTHLNMQTSLSTTSLELPGETTKTLDATAVTANHGNGFVHNRMTTDVVSDGVHYDYSYVQSALVWGGPNPDKVDLVTVTGPNGFSRTVDVEYNTSKKTSRIMSIKDSQNRTTTYGYNSSANNSFLQLRSITYPEGNSVHLEYDGPINIKEMRTKAKPSSGLPDIVQQANYPLATGDGIECTSVTCFLPNWTKDAKGNQTDYVWAGHGGLVSQLDPVNASNKRRKVKNTYAQSASGIWRMTQSEICQANSAGTEETCGSTSSRVTQTSYWNNTLLPLAQTLTDGVGTAPITTTFTYDAAGRQVSMNGPRAGSDDATYYRYDILGRKIWEIGPKGENGRRPATKTYYRDADDKPEKVETGTVAGGIPSVNTASIAFLEMISVAETDFNSRRLATKTVVSDDAGTKFGVTQMSYDTLNREQCSAVRMNAATWNSLPASACTMGAAGALGPDRISKKHYDTESRVTRIEQGVGSSLVRDYATYSFTPNGQMASMTDARGFKASMMYDGFDRQTHWYFPSKTTTGAINPADYEQYSYDANGNRTTLRKRDGSVLTYQYDKLNRVTKKIVPQRAGLNATHTRDVWYRYTIFGEQDIARFDSIGGHGLYMAYDRYGRKYYDHDTMDGQLKRLWHYFNTDGSRRLLRHSDLKWVRYNYTTGGQFNEVRDHANVQIADYDYDAQGRLAAIDRNSSAPDQTWTYDLIGRLETTGWLNAGSNNVSWAFTRNPASQILTESQTNDSYSWDDQVNVTRNYTTNGLNQYTNVSGQAYCYDANGNLTLDGQYAYLYDVENRLVEMRAKANSNCNALAYTGQIKAKLRYDPQGRLHETENFINGVGQGVTRYLHDGDALVAEYNSAGTMLKRYIHGPNAGVDDPIAEFTGSGVGISARRNLYADARGSIALSTNGYGTAAQINSYDEYGQPDANNTGRFQYTGQVWLPEIGMYYYKARIYSPKLGRFMQTDPIGYEDNVNLYAYTGNDPINKKDPTGESGVAVARGVIGLIAADVAVPEPTDAALPKWAAYAVIGGIAAIVVATADDGPSESTGADDSTKPRGGTANEARRGGNRGRGRGGKQNVRGNDPKPSNAGEKADGNRNRADTDAQRSKPAQKPKRNPTRTESKKPKRVPKYRREED